MRHIATDFSGNGAGNPFSSPADSATATPTGGATPQGQTDTSAATAKPDEQMLNSSVPSGGNVTPANPTQASYDVGCLDCGDNFAFARVASNMRCFCGSNNLVYEAADETPLSADGYIAIHYPKGLIGLVGPEGEGYHYSLARGDDLYTAGWAPAEDDAKNIVETLAPSYARARTAANYGGWEDAGPGKQKDHVWMGNQPSPSDPGKDWIVHHKDGTTILTDSFATEDEAFSFAETKFVTASLGTWVAADFPPKKDDKDKKKDDEDKGGNETHPPAGDSGGEEAPAPAAGTPPEVPQEGTQPPGAVPVDPNAPPAPGAVPGEVVDPLLQVMDTAQQQVDAAVDQANQLGHDAKEVAYDVDQLFSNWRCQNCQIEGEANISDDGQTSLDGDLFANQPCAAPSAPEENQNAENQVPQQAQQNQLPQGAPATNDQIPVTQQGIPSQTSAIRFVPECEKCGWRGKTWNEKEWADYDHDQHAFLEHNDEFRHTLPKPKIPTASKTATDGDGDGDDPDQRNVLDQQTAPATTLAKEERHTAMVEQILDTNPGMNAQAARRVAEATVAKFPSLAS